MKVLNSFSIFLANKNKALNTIKQYNEKLKNYIKWMDKNKLNVYRAKEIDVERYLDYCMQNGDKAKTRNNKLFAIKSFYKYLAREGVVRRNPAMHIEALEIGQPNTPNYLDENEVLKLINHLGKRNYKRNLAIIMFGAILGLRRCEIVGLNIQDVVNGRLRVVGKGNKERWVTVSDKVMGLLDDYLLIRPESKSNALFLSEQKERLKPESINAFLSDIQKKAGLKTGVHILRHTAATMTYKAVQDIYAVQKLLGHNDIKTTEIYTHITNERNKEVIESNPLNNII